MSSQRFPSLDPNEFPSKPQLPATAAHAAAPGAHYHGKHTHHKPMNRLLMWMLLLCGASAVAMLSANRYLLSIHVLDSPILPHLDEPPLDPQVHAADERLFRLVVDECLKAEDSVIWVDKSGEMVVQESSLVGKHCPSLDIMLPKEDRHLTVCSDAAHYIIHTSARLIPLQDKEQYDSYCGAATARLFLESLYQPFISLRPDVLHLKLVSPSRLWLSDAKLHKHMNVFLCKTRHCQELMKRHIVRMGWRSHVWLLGHTAGDPTIDLPPTSEAVKGALGPSFLYTQGGSQSTVSQQLVDCWKSQPDFPKLTIVGRFNWQDVKDSMDALNIEYYPAVSEGTDGNQQQPSFTHIRQLQVQTPMHICLSETDDSLSCIEEARSSGAMVVTVDHPPMSELVEPTTGYLMQPERLLSYSEQALGQYMPLHAAVGATRLCDAIEDVLGFRQQELHSRGQQARQQYLYDKAVFLARMQDMRVFLQQRSHGVYSMDHRVSLWHHGGVLQQRQASSNERYYTWTRRLSRMP